MTAYGYALSSEEHAPGSLVEYAKAAEEAGFEFALISDHYHPWVSSQGNSGFVWAMLGAISQATKTLRVGTGVTCPTMRIHPAIIAQAAATTSLLFRGRFFLGLGAGENLNEHILGDRWPRPDERHAMLREAIEVIRALWTGEVVSHEGEFFTVDEARLYSLPDELPSIFVAASGPDSATLAAEYGDGLIGVAPDADMIRTFRGNDAHAPAFGQVTICYAESKSEAEDTLAEWWPTSGLKGDLNWETKTPELFEAACKTLSKAQITEHTPCGPDVGAIVEAVRKFEDAGYSHIYLHQIGPEQRQFLNFYENELGPALAARDDKTPRKRA